MDKDNTKWYELMIGVLVIWACFLITIKWGVIGICCIVCGWVLSLIGLLIYKSFSPEEKMRDKI